MSAVAQAAVEAPPPHEQARLLQEVLHGEGAKLEVGENWYVVSMRWWDLWKEFTRFSEETSRKASEDSQDQPSFRRQSSGISKGDCPPEIDNSDLTLRSSDDCARLKSGIMERSDFTLVHSSAWELLHKWYGGGPALKRRVISVGSGAASELRVELYPLWLTVYRVDLGGHPQKDSKMDVECSRSETVEQVLKNLCTNLEIVDDTDANVRLWYRSSVEVDQTDTDAFDGWEQLQPADSTLEDLAVVDGASLLLEQSSASMSPSAKGGSDDVYNWSTASTSGVTDGTAVWPFFRRLRVNYKKQNFKDPTDPTVRLEVDDQIDASAQMEKREWDSSSRSTVMVMRDFWFAATVVEVDEERVLLQFHNREKPKGKAFTAESLMNVGEIVDTDAIKDGAEFESKDSGGNWHPVTITGKNSDGTFSAAVHDNPGNRNWPIVHAENIRHKSTLTAEAESALQKVFKRYESDGRIESGGLRGLMSCATNEYIQEDSSKVKELLEQPYGDGSGLEADGFMEFWRTKLAASGGAGFWIQQQLSRLFERVGAQVEVETEEDKLLKKGREWITRDSPRLAQYRSKATPGFQDARQFRDFRRLDKLDACIGGEWKQAEVKEVNWDEMTILVQAKSANYSSSQDYKPQREWIPMESDRIAEHETKSLDGPEDELDPAPLLARSISCGGVCTRPGACGLQNIGNTCFMNSTLQCLSNVAALRFFFAGGPDDAPAFTGEISTSPLSMEGKLAREFSRVLRMMWSNTHKSFAPAQLKKLIGQKRPEFNGYQQHDAHELLSFLLDGLHEDINRAPYPPPNIADVDNSGKPDEEVAKMQWDNYLKRNDSRIVDLFQFQVRSELCCPECENVSITFDPTMYMSLPVPKPPHSVYLIVLPMDFPSTPMSNARVEVPKTATFDQLEEALWTVLGRSPAERTSCFSFADVLNDRIYKQFEKTNPVSDIRINDRVFAIETALTPDVAESAHTFVPVCFRKREIPTSSSANQWAYSTFLPPRVIAVTSSTTNAMVYAQLKDKAERMLAHSEISQPWELAIQTDLEFYGSDGGLPLPDDAEEFQVPKQVGVDFLDAKVVHDTSNALPKVAQGSGMGASSGGTSLHDCLLKNGEREQLSEADSAYCSKCKEFRRQFKKLNLWSLPPVLIIHLKRFGRDRVDGPLVKIGIAVDFPVELDLSQYMCLPGAENTIFELFGVINHHGTVGGGHYTAHAIVTTTSDRGTAEGEWFCFNDSSVSKAVEADLDHEAGYILFYRRKQ